MGILSIKMPDIGEGIAEAELVEWLVKEGDLVREDQPLAAVMTDKATVEIPSPASGKVAWLGGTVGDTIAVKAELIRLEVEGAGNVAAGDAAGGGIEPPSAAGPQGAAPRPGAGSADEDGSGEAGQSGAEGASGPQRGAGQAGAAQGSRGQDSGGRGGPAGAGRAEAGHGGSRQGGSARHGPTPPLRAEGERPLATPSVRQRAREAGVDLRFVRGSGPAGRISHDDLTAYIEQGAPQGSPQQQRDGRVEEVKVIGLRRKIAERMQLAKRNIPHITIVEEVDVTALEELRARLNEEAGKGGSGAGAKGVGASSPGGTAGAPRPKLTVLPFLMKAMVKTLREQPGINAIYDEEAGVIRRYGGVHIGIATQTPAGLMVPVARHAEAMSLWDAAEEVSRLADAARKGTAAREELSGSTITITSLGPLGAIATTPIINHPEVAIVGVNRMAIRPHWDGSEFVPRKMMNLSCSFDHRVIDGWDAAVFVQRLKVLLETPAMIFVEG